MAITIGTGTTIAFATGFFAEIISAKWAKMSRGMTPTSHMGTTNALTFKENNLYDPGELEVELHHIPATRPPIDIAQGACSITLPGGKIWAVTAFMTEYSFDVPFEDKIKATATLKFSGAFTIT